MMIYPKNPPVAANPSSENALTRFAAAAGKLPPAPPEEIVAFARNFLSTASVRAAALAAVPDGTLTEKSVELAARILASPEWFDLFGRLHSDLFRVASSVCDYGNPPEADYLSEDTGMFQFLLALSALPLIREKHRAMGIPEKYTAATALWIGGTVPTYAAGHDGRPGHDLRQTQWLGYSIKGRLFRIGRFEFLLEDSVPAFLPEIFRRRSDGAVLALARDGWTFDADGFRMRRGDCAAPAFTAQLIEDVSGITGVPILPCGRARTPEVVLKKSDWVRIEPEKLGKASLHIPGGGGMTPEVAAFSLSKARRFFQKYLHRELDLVFCGSWILEPVLEEKLPHSNIAKLQRQLYLVPVEHDGVGDLFFVFGRSDTARWREFPATNTMQKTILDVLRSGRPYRNGGMFLLAEEIPQWGSEPYRSGFPL